MVVDIRGRRDGEETCVWNCVLACASHSTALFLPWWGEDRADGIWVMEMGRINTVSRWAAQVRDRDKKEEVEEEDGG